MARLPGNEGRGHEEGALEGARIGEGQSAEGLPADPCSLVYRIGKACHRARFAVQMELYMIANTDEFMLSV